MTTDTKPGAMPEWVLVPVEPTQEILDALYGLSDETGGDDEPARRLWRSVIDAAVFAAAAPPPPTGAQGSDAVWNEAIEEAAKRIERDWYIEHPVRPGVPMTKVEGDPQAAKFIRALKRQSGEG